MVGDSASATRVINAPAEAVFAVLADPAKHAAIDGTGWVRESADRVPLTAAGQIFGMSMYHQDHPDGSYQMFNRIQVFDPPRSICWKPGYDAGDGTLGFGGWIWRYDLTPLGPTKTTVTLTYYWSAVSDSTRERIGFSRVSAAKIDKVYLGCCRCLPLRWPVRRLGTSGRHLEDVRSDTR